MQLNTFSNDMYRSHVSQKNVLSKTETVPPVLEAAAGGL
jgi:hypothetical protein